MSKRKRAERLVGKTIEGPFPGDRSKVLAVEVHAIGVEGPDGKFVHFMSDNQFLCLKLEVATWHGTNQVRWEKVNSRVRYRVL